jgi:hypothetical protein
MTVDIDQLAKAIANEGKIAKNETDLRVRIEPLMDQARVDLGLAADPEREKSLDASTNTVTLRGRADTMYGGVVIEYEPPGALAAPASTAHGVKQAREYMLMAASEAKGRELESLRRHGGLVIDGRQVVFLRPNGPASAAPLASQLETLIPQDGPHPITPGAVAQILLYLRALGRKRLDGRALAATFGPDSKHSQLARDFVSYLIERLADPSLPPKAQLLVNEWTRVFGAVYSQDATKARRDAGLLAALYGVPTGTKLPILLFCVQTYYAFLMKLLAVEILSLQAGALVASQASRIASANDEDEEELLSELEDGGIFRAHGIENFLEGDYFRWYIDAWTPSLASLCRRVALELTQFEPATSTLDPDAVRDLLKELYQYLVPKKVRHDLGEYYTPDWLADYTLDRASYDGSLDSRFLDPACGSGTFLMRAIARIKDRAFQQMADEETTARAILGNVYGYDLNPVAVLAARTNYLLALGNLIRRVTPLRIPVYLADSLLAPMPYGRLVGSSTFRARSNHLVRRSSEGDFKYPLELANSEGLQVVTEELERGIAAAIGPEDFVKRVEGRISLSGSRTETLLTELFEKVQKLESQGKNGIWARLLRNAFAPVFAGRFDFVIGNPPWINWESLSDDYRTATSRLWELHGLFTLKGMKAILGGSKRDVAMLFWMCAADYYLNDGGVIAFLFPQTALQTSPAGDGFRKFTLSDTTQVAPNSAADLVAIQPFDGASNWTALLVGRKGQAPSYPIPYQLWARGTEIVRQDDTLETAVAKSRILDLAAAPVDAKQDNAPWLIGTVRTIPAGQRMLGPNPYDGKAGLTTWADGIYFGSITGRLASGEITFSNDASRAKGKKPRVRPMSIEPAYVFPFVEWRDIAPFDATPSTYVLVPQDPAARQGFAESVLRVSHPRTFDYLSQFRTELEKRSGYRRYFSSKGGRRAAFYSIFNFGKENAAEYRVVWRTMGTRIRAAVLEPQGDAYLGDRSAQVKNTVIFVAAESRNEAHYLCALLNSTPYNYLAVFSSPRGGKSFGSGGFFKRVRLDKFDSADVIHTGLANASIAAHAARAGTDEVAFSAAVAEIDTAAAKYWLISPAEFEEMRDMLLDADATALGGLDPADVEDEQEPVE